MADSVFVFVIFCACCKTFDVRPDLIQGLLECPLQVGLTDFFRYHIQTEPYVRKKLSRNPEYLGACTWLEGRKGVHVGNVQKTALVNEVDKLDVSSIELDSDQVIKLLSRVGHAAAQYTTGKVIGNPSNAQIVQASLQFCFLVVTQGWFPFIARSSRLRESHRWNYGAIFFGRLAREKAGVLHMGGL